MTPTAPGSFQSFPQSTAPGTDPRVLLQILFQQIEDNSVTFSQLLAANAIAGMVDSWRIVFRWLAVDTAANAWGTPNWGLYGDISSDAGTTNLQQVGFWMARSRVNADGAYEVQLKVNGQWYSAASLLMGAPAVPNAIPGVPQIYMPGPPLNIFSFHVYATTPQAPAYPPVQSNPTSPVGSAIPGFTNGYHNVGGPNWVTDGMKDPSGQYALENPSPMLNDWSKMIWVKVG